MPRVLYPTRASPPVVEPALDSWFRPAQEPARPPPRCREGWACAPLEPSLVLTPVLDWLRPAERPVRPRPRPTPGETTFVNAPENYAPPPPDTVTLDMWFRPAGVPTRRAPQPFWSGWYDRCPYVAPAVAVVPTPPPTPATPGGRATPLGIGSADSDALRAFQDRYEAAGGSLVGDRLYTSDLPARLELPYAQVQSAQLKPPDFQASIDGLDYYLDYRLVTLTLVGVGKRAVGDLLEQLKGAYAFRSFEIPNAFHRATWLAGESLKPDPAPSRRGERAYRGTLQFHLWAVRVVPARRRA